MFYFFHDHLFFCTAFAPSVKAQRNLSREKIAKIGFFSQEMLGSSRTNLVFHPYQNTMVPRNEAAAGGACLSFCIHWLGLMLREPNLSATERCRKLSASGASHFLMMKIIDLRQTLDSPALKDELALGVLVTT